MITKLLLLAAVVSCLLIAGLIYQAVGARQSARRYPPPGELVEVCGQRLHVVRAGSGQPAVLFEAGVAASSLSWTRVMPEVATFARACAYDRPGLGWSDASRSSRTVDRMVAELHGVIARASTDPVVLVGHSFGTFLALVHAARHPDDVAGLVLLDPPTDWQVRTPSNDRLLARGIQASHLGGVLARAGIVRASLALLTGGAPGVTRNGIRVLGPRAVRTLEHLAGEVRKLPADVHPLVQSLWCQPKCFRGMAEHLAALPAIGAAAADVTSLDLPLAIVSAGDHPPDVIAAHRRLASVSPRGRHIVAAGSGHWIQLDEPELVVTAIRAVIDEANTRAISARS